MPMLRNILKVDWRVHKMTLGIIVLKSIFLLDIKM